MTPTGPQDPDLLSSSDPDPDPSRGRPRRRLLAGFVTVALLAAGATGVALASDRGSSGTQPDGFHRFGGRALGGPGFAGPGGAGVGGPLGALHGELVVPKQGGGYETLVVQRGTVRAVSARSITVKSEDGFTESYAVTADTLVNAARDGISSIDDGAQVSVLARKGAGDPTALHIADRSEWDGLRGGLGLRRGDRGHEERGRPEPAPSGTSTTSSSLGA